MPQPTDRSVASVAWMVLDEAPDGVVIVEAQGRIAYANRRLARQFGAELDDLVGSPVEELLPHAQRDVHRSHRRRYAEAPVARPMGTGLVLHGLRRDGTTFPVEISLSPVRWGDGEAVVATVRDISERLRTEVELQRTERERDLLADRERIARDLHDTVIQELFATGMSLEAALSGIEDEASAERVSDAVDALDRTIRRIRTAIFGLQSGRDTELRTEVVSDITEVCRAAGLELEIDFTGAAEEVAGPVAGHVLPVLREAVTNAARHGQARRVAIHMDVGDQVCLIVEDDGVGIDLDLLWPDPTSPPRPDRGEGLRNLYERADELGGSLHIARMAGGGTHLQWSVPNLTGTAPDQEIS